MKIPVRWFIVVPMLLTAVIFAVLALPLVWAGQFVFFKINHRPVYVVGVPTVRALTQRIETIIKPKNTSVTRASSS